MKKLFLLTTLVLSLMLSGCGIPDGDFWGDTAVIVEKTQTKFDRQKHQARFKIGFEKGGYMPRWYIMNENFGEVGDIIHATNKVLYVESPN